jgi:hypothetical protein
MPYPYTFKLLRSTRSYISAYMDTCLGDSGLMKLVKTFVCLTQPSHDVENCLCSKLGESAVDYQDSEAFCKLALQVATDTPALLRDRKER